MGKHIPGNPALIPVNMPGGGGITAANYMAQVAPRDGTVIGIVSQGLAADQALGMSPQLKADSARVQLDRQCRATRTSCWWSGTPRRPRRLRTPRSAKPRSAPPARARPRCSIPAFYNNVLGTKFKIVFGYPGGQDIDLAMERGEVEGRGTNPYSGWMASKPTWIPQKLIIPLVQAGMEKEPALPDVPLIIDLPVKPADKPMLEFMARAPTVGRPLATTPGRAGRARGGAAHAFAATLKDPDFIAAAANEQLQIRPMTGDKLREGSSPTSSTRRRMYASASRRRCSRRAKQRSRGRRVKNRSNSRHAAINALSVIPVRTETHTLRM